MSDAAAPLAVLLVDDEPLARLRLGSLLREIDEPATTVVAEAADADTALQQLRTKRCDLVLLDIGLPGRDGLRLAGALRALPRPPAVVFVTAHAEHALRAFDLEAVDYLTKPVARERLRSALRRVAQRLRPVPPEPARDEPVLVVSDRGRVLRVPRDDVLYLKAELKYVTLRTAGHAYVLDDALAELEHRLGDGFVRVHRNALVAKAAVRTLERRVLDADDGGAPAETWAVRIEATGEWLAVSRRQLPAVREALRR